MIILNIRIHQKSSRKIFFFNSNSSHMIFNSLLMSILSFLSFYGLVWNVYFLFSCIWSSCGIHSSKWEKLLPTMIKWTIMIKYYSNKLNRNDGNVQSRKQSLKHYKEKNCAHNILCRWGIDNYRYHNDNVNIVFSVIVIIVIKRITY